MKNSGFTLVEIMIVVAVIGILAAIAIPNFSRNRMNAQKNACIENMRQIQGAIEMVLMRGEPVNEETVSGEVRVWEKLYCPSTRQSYENPEIKDGEYRVLCPSLKDGHELSFGTEAN